MSLIFFVRVRRGSDGWMATFWLSQHSGWRAEHGEQTVNEDYDQGLKRLWCTKNHAKYIYIFTDISYSKSCFWTWFQSVRTRINSNRPHYCRICIGCVLDDVLKWILNALNQHFLRWRGDQWEAQFDQHKCAEFEGHVRPKTFLTWPEIALFGR